MATTALLLALLALPFGASLGGALPLAPPGLEPIPVPPGWPTSFAELYRCNGVVATSGAALVAARAEASGQNLPEGVEDPRQTIDDLSRAVSEEAANRFVILPSNQVYNPPCVIVGLFRHRAAAEGCAEDDRLFPQCFDGVVRIQNLDLVPHTPSDVFGGFAAEGDCFRESLAPQRIMVVRLRVQRLSEEPRREVLFTTSRLNGEPDQPLVRCGSSPTSKPRFLPIPGIAEPFRETFDEVELLLDRHLGGAPLEPIQTAIGPKIRIPFRCSTHDFEAELRLQFEEEPQNGPG